MGIERRSRATSRKRKTVARAGAVVFRNKKRKIPRSVQPTALRTPSRFVGSPSVCRPKRRDPDEGAFPFRKSSTDSFYPLGRSKGWLPVVWQPVPAKGDERSLGWICWTLKTGSLVPVVWHPGSTLLLTSVRRKKRGRVHVEKFKQKKSRI